jgi:hypothetical protein
VSGRTVGGTQLYTAANRLDRMEALRRYTVGSAWFSGEVEKKGAIVPGQFADLAVLSADYFSIPEDDIKRIESVLTVVDGKVVYGAKEFTAHAPASLPVLPDWSPVKNVAADQRQSASGASGTPVEVCCRPHVGQDLQSHAAAPMTNQPLWGLGCDCFAF